MQRVLPQRIGLIFLIGLILVIASGCGRSGSPKPPEEISPSPVEFLTVRPSQGGLEFSWTAPANRVDGEELGDLKEFLVERSDYERDSRPDFDTIARVPVKFKDPNEPGSGRKSQNPFAPEKQGDYKPIEKQYRYRDASVKPGAQYEYIVRGVTEGGYEGEPAVRIRVKYLGDASVIETLQVTSRDAATEEEE